MNGLDSQNKNLRDAAAQPKDTSPRVKNSTGYSARVASSSSKSVESTDPTPVVTSDRGGTRRIQGSYEGLMHAPSAVLQPNGVGYDDKKMQTARYNKTFASHGERSMSPSLNNSQSYSIMNNYSSVTNKQSSSDRLSHIVNNNMMFK